MHSQMIGLRVASIVFAIVCLVHLWRLITGAPVIVGSWVVPMSASWAGLIVTGGLSLWFWGLSNRRG